jgi:prefoldin subunit 4
LENLEEAGNELLVSDETAAPYVLGECFVVLPNEAAEARLQAESEAAEKEVSRLNVELGRIKGEMDALKKVRRLRYGVQCRSWLTLP